jgi:hypothetical protein
MPYIYPFPLRSTHSDIPPPSPCFPSPSSSFVPPSPSSGPLGLNRQQPQQIALLNWGPCDGLIRLITQQRRNPALRVRHNEHLARKQIAYKVTQHRIVRSGRRINRHEQLRVHTWGYLWRFADINGPQTNYLAGPGNALRQYHTDPGCVVAHHFAVVVYEDAAEGVADKDAVVVCEEVSGVEVGGGWLKGKIPFCSAGEHPVKRGLDDGGVIECCFIDGSVEELDIGWLVWRLGYECFDGGGDVVAVGLG